MNNLPAPKLFPFPPRTQAFKSWGYIAGVFQERAEHERKLGWERLGVGDQSQFARHMVRAEMLDEAAAWCRGQDDA